MSRLGKLLLENKYAQIGEIIAVFAAAIVFLFLFTPLAGDNPIALQGVVWFANILMLLVVWMGLRVRGQAWKQYGLRFDLNRRQVVRTFFQSIPVFLAAVAAAALTAVIAANIVGVPEQADLSEFNFLRGNPALLILSLVGVYIVSSFGEEVIYRGFLITRLEELGSSTRLATVSAVIASSMVFGLVHYDWTLAGILQTVSIGLVLGVSFLIGKRNLWVNILAHVYLDTLLLIQIYLAPA